MKKNTLFLFLLVSIFQINLNAQAWQWAVSSESDEAFYTTTDPTGNVYQIGKMIGDATFQGGVTLSQGGDYYTNWFLAKYNTAGQLQWVKEAFSQRGDREVLALASDADGNIYYSGYFDDTLRVQASSAISRGGRDAFLIKLNSSGNFQWLKTGGGDFDDSFNDIICANSNIYIVGTYVPNATFETTTLEGTTHEFSTEAMLLSYSSSGNLNYAKRFGGISSETGDGIFVHNNKIYFTGFFRSDDAVFQTITLDWSGTGNQFDTYLACTDMSGNIEFAKGFSNKISGLLFRKRNTVFANNSGVFLAGHFTQMVNFGNGPLTTSSNLQNGYLAKFNFDGDNLWATTFKGQKYVSAQKVIGDNDQIYVAGGFTDTLKIADQNYIGIFNNFSVSENNGYISSWNNDGTLAWTKIILPYQNPDYLSQIGVFRLNGFSMDNNFLFVSGVFTMSLQLPPYSVSTDGNSSNNDAVLAKIDINANAIEQMDQSSMQCYPNPATNCVFIETTRDEISSIILRNMTGNIVLIQKTSGSNVEKIDLSNISQGVYLLEVISSKNKMCRKIIIQ